MSAWTQKDERDHLDRMLKNHGQRASAGSMVRIDGIVALATWLKTVKTRRWHEHTLKNAEMRKDMLELVPTAKAYLANLRAKK